MLTHVCGLQELVPAATRVLVTTARPSLKDYAHGDQRPNFLDYHTSDQFEKGELGRMAWLSYMNAASRGVAHRLNWNMLDLAAMTDMFPSPSVYLRDPYHPNGSVLSEMLNVALNIISDLRHRDAQRKH